jgi:hypothetical protein
VLFHAAAASMQMLRPKRSYTCGTVQVVPLYLQRLKPKESYPDTLLVPPPETFSATSIARSGKSRSSGREQRCRVWGEFG